MLEGEAYRKLILVDGKPMDEKLQKRVDQDLAKVQAEHKKKRGGGMSLSRTFSTKDIDSIEQYLDRKVIGEETTLGRKTWRMESEPKPGYKPAARRSPANLFVASQPPQLPAMLAQHRCLQQAGSSKATDRQYVWAPPNGHSDPLPCACLCRPAMDR